MNTPNGVVDAAKFPTEFRDDPGADADPMGEEVRVERKLFADFADPLMWKYDDIKPCVPCCSHCHSMLPWRNSRVRGTAGAVLFALPAGR